MLGYEMLGQYNVNCIHIYIWLVVLTLAILKIYASQPTSHGFSLRSPTEVDAQTCFCTESSETKPSNLLGILWILMNFNGDSMGFYGFKWGFYGILWILIYFNGDSMGFYGV